MSTYVVQLELRSGLGTPLAADTMWGHICWGMRYRSGEKALADWLDRYEADDPPLVLSDPFPAGYWPRPALTPVPWPVDPPSVDEADRRKQLVKRSWISHSAWDAIRDALSPENVDTAVLATQTAPPPNATQAAVAHAAINRITGGTSQPEGGTLFSAEQSYFKGFPKFEIWSRSPDAVDTVGQWFEDGLLGGYGRDAGTGLGNLVITDIAEATLTGPDNANAVMLLGSVVPKPTDPHRGFFKWGIRRGRLGGDYAIGALPDGSTVRQKRPVRCLLTGSVLLSEPPAPSYVGRLVAGVHAFPAIRHYAMTPTLPCRLDPETLRDALLKRIGWSSDYPELAP
jgi:CRISPR-associated protein Csm4